jgi:hypothetical protein
MDWAQAQALWTTFRRNDDAVKPRKLSGHPPHPSVDEDTIEFLRECSGLTREDAIQRALQMDARRVQSL